MIDRFNEICRRIAQIEDEGIIGDILEDLDDSLNTIRTEDGFGTEGQCDPRGDFREGDWSVWNMKGYDGD